MGENAMTHTAEHILELASADPERAVKMAASHLAEKPGAGDREESILRRAMSVANGRLGRFQESIDLAEQARDIAARSGDREQQLLSTLTMVRPMVILGRSTEALRLIEDAADLATTPYLESRVSFQRGVVWAMRGQRLRAIEAFEAALPAFVAAGDLEMVRSTLHGRGDQRLAIGDLPRARRDLEEALSIALSRNEEPIVSGIEHNLGLLASYRGDIPEALALLLDSEEIYMRLTGATAPQHVARCEVLLSVGRFHEAYGLAVQISEHQRAKGDPEHLANALLVAARAALLAGDFENALTTAERAAAHFESRERPVDALDARRIAIEARYLSEGASEDLLVEARDVADSLESDRQMVAAAQARLLVSRIAFDLDELEEAMNSLDSVSEIDSGPVELRIQGRVARARLRMMLGDHRGADAAARAGLRLIDDYQAALGATDLRMGLEQHGAELGSIGMALALGSADPRRILRWMDRTRGRALRHRPVFAEGDEAIQESLARLRQVEAELRAPDNRGAPGLEREKRRLQERIRTADRLKRARSTADQSVDMETLMADLDDRCLFELAIHEGHLVGVVAIGGRVRRADLGEADPALRELAHIRFGMRRAARRGRSLETRSLEDLDRMLVADLVRDQDEVILVPPPPLMATPWSGLPGLRGKTLTIAPSAEMWWRSEHAMPLEDGVVIAGGPDLDVAESEVAEIARIYVEATVLPPGVTVDELREALAGTSLAHIACHATFQSENPMFSSLRLGDGNLNVYDIERLPAPPSIVVLSACDSGYTEATAGVELAGLTSALLSMGTRSVVASVGLVPDSPTTSDLMVRFHRRLAGGMKPAQALAQAQAESYDDPASFVAAASFICVGA
jgi:tetratricopeptide (TPR) repeat protein